MRTNVRFKTKKFEPPADTNEPFSGTELADWLIQVFEEPYHLDYLDEDYYCILFLGAPIEKKLIGGCGYVENNTWQIFMQLKPSFMDKLFKKPLPTELHKNFIQALDEELQSNEEFFDIEWYEEDSKLQEHNYGKRAFG